VAFFLKVKRDWLDEYKEIHKDVWPEMQQALAEAGWHNYSLFMREDGDFELDRLPIHPLQRGQVRCSTPPNRFFAFWISPCFKPEPRPMTCLELSGPVRMRRAT
jgi:hypothetical protein